MKYRPRARLTYKRRLELGSPFMWTRAAVGGKHAVPAVYFVVSRVGERMLDRYHAARAAGKRVARKPGSVLFRPSFAWEGR